MKNTFSLIIIVLCIACKHDDPTPKNTGNGTSSRDTTNNNSLAGEFKGYAHNLAGHVFLQIDSSGMKTLNFDNYTMAAGPDVHVYISKTNNYSKANTIEVAKLTTGYSNNSISLDLSSVTFTPEYNFILVYCLQYNALFGYAELK